MITAEGSGNDGRIRIRFVQTGIDENPFDPRSWSCVPRIGEMVFLSETGLRYEVIAVQWNCTEQEYGTHNKDNPVVIVTLQHAIEAE